MSQNTNQSEIENHKEKSGWTPSSATLETVVSKTKTGVENYVAPVRETMLARYPTLFSLLVTLGATAVFLGLEQILLQFDILYQEPWLILLLGIGILLFTGRFYKKLD